MASELGRHAVTYAGLGLEVFPVDPKTKAPRESQLHATTDLDMVEGWWGRWPDSLIGHRVAPDVLLLDVDPRHGGKETWAALKREAKAPATRTHYSGRGDGGGHLWFKRPPDRKLTTTKLDTWAKERDLGQDLGGRWTSGIDLLRREHRYTILPPSPHPDTGEPYRWAKGKSLTMPPADLPLFVVGLLTAPEVAAKPQGPMWADPDSIADWYSRTHGFGALLSAKGWEVTSGDGEEDGSSWRHPEASGPVSATISNGCLFVYSTSTPFEPTQPGSPQGYTPFRAWAVLEHGGNLEAAARAARALKQKEAPGWSGPGDHVKPNEEEPGGANLPAVATGLPEAFWRARPILNHIRFAAHARQRSADAVFHTVLARVAAITPHTVVLPAIVGTVKPLCYYAGIVAEPGVGKSDANGIAAELLPAPEWVADQLPLGSGEGLTELLFDLVEEPGENGSKKQVKRQVRHNAYVYVDEGQVMAEMGGRSGATLLPALRTIWTGGPLGQTNARRETHRVAPALSYTFGVVAGFQLARVGPLLEDAEAGLPQRFGFAYALDPTIPDLAPGWPGVLGWEVPPRITGGSGGDPLGVAPEIAAEIRAADLARSRGEATTERLDAHAGLYRLKVAGLLAVLDGRREISVEDWVLAAVVKTSSDAVRAGIVSHLEAQTRRTEHQWRERQAGRQIAVTERARESDAHRAALYIARKVHREPDRWTVSALRRSSSDWVRDVWGEALDRAQLAGWVSEESEAGGPGSVKRRLVPGEPPS